jgi:hypothetical protein
MVERTKLFEVRKEDKVGWPGNQLHFKWPFSEATSLSQNENAGQRADVGIRTDHVVPLAEAAGCGRAGVGGDESARAAVSADTGAFRTGRRRQAKGENGWAWADVEVRGGKFGRLAA